MKNERGKGKGDSGRIPGVTDPMNNVKLSHAIRKVSRPDISFEKDRYYNLTCNATAFSLRSK